jgi:hypothetical protein
MVNPKDKNSPNSPRNPKNLSPEKYARLKAEARAPYRGLRKFVYVSFGASGAIGAFIFFLQLLAGRQVSSTLPNLALQVGLVALMVWLFRLESRNDINDN